MSSVMESRAAVFTSQPQAVEVFHAGVWWAGQLLGWRHDDSGACQVWVRVAVDGVEETAWTDLATLRLPERPASAVAVSTAPQRSEAMVTQAVAVEPASALRRADAGSDTGSGAEATASLPLVRDQMGRSAPRRSGGRRRAPEDVDVQVAPASSVPVPPPGRHRAPAEVTDIAAGRHRAADTGLLPAVVEAGSEAPSVRRDEISPTARRSVPVARTALAGESSLGGRGWMLPAGLEADLLTRPMRLSDQVPHARRPRVSGSVPGA